MRIVDSSNIARRPRHLRCQCRVTRSSRHNYDDPRFERSGIFLSFEANRKCGTAAQVPMSHLNLTGNSCVCGTRPSWPKYCLKATCVGRGERRFGSSRTHRLNHQILPRLFRYSPRGGVPLRDVLLSELVPGKLSTSHNFVLEWMRREGKGKGIGVTELREVNFPSSPLVFIFTPRGGTML